MLVMSKSIIFLKIQCEVPLQETVKRNENLHNLYGLMEVIKFFVDFGTLQVDYNYNYNS